MIKQELDYINLDLVKLGDVYFLHTIQPSYEAPNQTECCTVKCTGVQYFNKNSIVYKFLSLNNKKLTTFSSLTYNINWGLKYVS